ncbi:MAG: hypothetical protein M0R17_03035 [Candidatus Omnitrophica bacterium]|jgi:hypothetical protein|nr:hypothetical protein [Candidatus Omnitrophota bacterium]
MKDFLGREIRIGDYVLHICSNEYKYLTYVIDITKAKVRIESKWAWSKKSKTFIDPDNCIVFNDIPLDKRINSIYLVNSNLDQIQINYEN